MPTNFFFDNFGNGNEQGLLEDLIIESIQIYGQDMYYIPRVLHKFDPIYTADDQSSFDNAYAMEMYIKSIDGFSGDGNFMSQFGVEIRDQVVFSMSRRIFQEEVGVNTNQVRPNEGDLIFFPLNQKCFQIRMVNKFEMFYQLGGLQTWEVTCELFEYSGERMATGIPEIDILMHKWNMNSLDFLILDEDGNAITDENGAYLTLEGSGVEDQDEGTAINDQIQRESNQFVDWSAIDPFSEGNI